MFPIFYCYRASNTMGSLIFTRRFAASGGCPPGAGGCGILWNWRLRIGSPCNIKKLREYAVLTQSVDFTEITEDYTEFESKLSKREKVLKTEPGQLQAVVDPTNVEFNRDFDRGMFLEKLLVVFFRSLCAINYYCMYLTTYFRLYQYVSESRQNII